MKYSIWKVPANISTFSFAPTNKEIQYNFSSSNDNLSFSKDEKVLILNLEPQKIFNTGITIVEKDGNTFRFSKDFEVSNGLPLSNVSDDLKNVIISSDTNYIEISESDYYSICSLIFSQLKIKDFINFIPKPVDEPNQLIFYGAPGTGKSDTIKREVDNKKQIRYRTTFHPDSDYSTFVGAYKPSMNGPHNIKLDMSFDDLASKLSEYYNDPDSGKIEGIQMFCKEYYKYIDGEFMAVSYDKLVKKAGISDNYAREIDKYVNFMHLMPKHDEKRIIYTFVPQAFTDAYVAAWNTEQPVFLIIEEINRGNCAQIFGDLFQLLDRKNGFSEYPIKADTDLANYLSDKFGKSPRKDIPDVVKRGEWLMLPNNLYIWATMNTSDQSLFPIDSAFKRRWEWRYIKIANGYRKDENGEYVVDGEGKKNPLGWKLEINNQDWWSFIQQINTIISSMTMSADKQLGYFFCKADDNGIISKEVFVNKVLFYLWNDVFKDYAEEDSSLFKYKVNPEDKDFADLTFPDFFEEDGKIEESVVKQFVDNVMNWKKDEQTKQDS